jgi:hypothetical protein
MLTLSIMQECMIGGVHSITTPAGPKKPLGWSTIHRNGHPSTPWLRHRGILESKHAGTLRDESWPKTKIGPSAATNIASGTEPDSAHPLDNVPNGYHLSLATHGKPSGPPADERGDNLKVSTCFSL